MKADRRFTEFWDERAQLAEKELLCGLSASPRSWAQVRWRDLEDVARRRLIGAMRQLYSLGKECETALAYRRPRRTGNGARE